MASYFSKKEFHIHYSHYDSSGDWQGKDYSHLLVNWGPNPGLPIPSQLFLLPHAVGNVPLSFLLNLAQDLVSVAPDLCSAHSKGLPRG